MALWEISAHSSSCGWLWFWETCFNVVWKEAYLFLWLFFYCLSRVLRTICCRLQLLVHPNKCSHAVLQDLRCAGAAVRGIHRSDFWNRQIVCLHVGPRLGQTVLGFKDFSLKAGKKREKEAVVWHGSRRISCLQGVPCYKGRKEMPRRESGRRAERPAKPLSDSDTFY